MDVLGKWKSMFEYTLQEGTWSMQRTERDPMCLMCREQQISVGAEVIELGWDDSLPGFTD